MRAGPLLTVARRQTYSSPSRRSSPHSHWSRCTSCQHRPSAQGYRSGKPGTAGGCGAGRLQGQRQSLCWTLGAQLCLLKQGQAANEVVKLRPIWWDRSSEHSRKTRVGRSPWKCSPQSSSCSSSPSLQLEVLSQTWLAGTQVTLSSHKKPVRLLEAAQRRFAEGKARDAIFWQSHAHRWYGEETKKISKSKGVEFRNVFVIWK